MKLIFSLIHLNGEDLDHVDEGSKFYIIFSIFYYDEYSDFD
jgi:hypothetical protein